MVNVLSRLPEIIGPMYYPELIIMGLVLATMINIILTSFTKFQHRGSLSFEITFSELLGNIAIVIGFIGTCIGLSVGLTNITPGDPTSLPKIFISIGNSIWSTVGGAVISAIAMINCFLGEKLSVKISKSQFQNISVDSTKEVSSKADLADFNAGIKFLYRNPNSHWSRKHKYWQRSLRIFPKLLRLLKVTWMSLINLRLTRKTGGV